MHGCGPVTPSDDDLRDPCHTGVVDVAPLAVVEAVLHGHLCDPGLQLGADLRRLGKHQAGDVLPLLGLSACVEEHEGLSFGRAVVNHRVPLLVADAKHGANGPFLAGEAAAARARPPEGRLVHGPILALGVLLVPRRGNDRVVLSVWRSRGGPGEGIRRRVPPELHLLARQALDHLAFLPSFHLEPVTEDVGDREGVVPNDVVVPTSRVVRGHAGHGHAARVVHEAVEEVGAEPVVRHQASLAFVGAGALPLRVRHAHAQVLEGVEAVLVMDALSKARNAGSDALRRVRQIAERLQEFGALPRLGRHPCVVVHLLRRRLPALAAEEGLGIQRRVGVVVDALLLVNHGKARAGICDPAQAACMKPA
mmetsp:Transcript_43836/g.136464  ORF Transcript_43836/g.136464 Transcript_43836/m.136464 type:complete len:365 (-) Transcript_43836:640-1734(-)